MVLQLSHSDAGRHWQCRWCENRSQDIAVHALPVPPQDEVTAEAQAVVQRQGPQAQGDLGPAQAAFDMIIKYRDSAI